MKNFAKQVSGAGKTRTHSGGNIADVVMYPNVDSCATFVADTNFVSSTQKCFWKYSETFLVSARRAKMLPRFATDGQHRRTQCCRHNVSLFCQGFSLIWLRKSRPWTGELYNKYWIVLVTQGAGSLVRPRPFLVFITSFLFDRLLHVRRIFKRRDRIQCKISNQLD